MPATLAQKFRFTRVIKGGPVFDFPQYNMLKIDLSTLTERQAERLVNAGWKGIARVPQVTAKTLPQTKPDPA